MTTYKILGIYSFAENLKNVKLNDPVIFKNEKYNVKSENAIGVYTFDNKKLGYLPTENNNKIFNLSYKISKLNLNQEYPLLEISKFYSLINYLDNIEYPYEKNIKYNISACNISVELNNMLIGLEKYLLTKKIKVKRSAIIYYDENYINILIEYSKYVNQFETVTLKYFKENYDKYEELYENKLIETIFYRNLLVYRLECYYEQNYVNILDYKKIINEYFFTEEQIHDKIDCSIIFCKIYIKYLITKDDFYLLKINENPKGNLFQIEKFVKDNNLSIGKFTYDHKLKIYDYIDFVNDDTVFIISDKIDKNYLYSTYLTNKINLVIYNPLKGNINMIYNIELKNLN
jgi:hypothetical protein